MIPIKDDIADCFFTLDLRNRELVAYFVEWYCETLVFTIGRPFLEISQSRRDRKPPNEMPYRLERISQNYRCCVGWQIYLILGLGCSGTFAREPVRKQSCWCVPLYVQKSRRLEGCNLR